MEFFPRRNLSGSDWAGGQNERRNHEHSKLPKNQKTNRLGPYFGRVKEIFSYFFIPIDLILFGDKV